MKTGALLLAGLIFVGCADTTSARTWEVTSPDQGQTFSFGSERHREWISWGQHLGIAMEFTNDPYVDSINFRQWDDFNFGFPNVTLGSDGKTFFFHPKGKEAIAVAIRHPSLLGTEIGLLPSSRLVVEKRHGLLRLTLLVSSPSLPVADDE